MLFATFMFDLSPEVSFPKYLLNQLLKMKSENC